MATFVMASPAGQHFISRMLVPLSGPLSRILGVSVSIFCVKRTSFSFVEPNKRKTRAMLRMDQYLHLCRPKASLYQDRMRKGSR